MNAENETLMLILGEIREVKTEVAGIKTELAEVKAEVAEVKTELAEVKAEVAGIKTELTDVKERLALIEHDHGKQLGALFDGYQLLYEISGEIRAGIAKLQARQEKHEMNLVMLNASTKIPS